MFLLLVGSSVVVPPVGLSHVLSKVIEREKRCAAQTYHPLPVVWTRAKGVDVVREKRHISIVSHSNQVGCRRETIPGLLGLVQRRQPGDDNYDEKER
jgi:hypothetical protein